MKKVQEKAAVCGALFLSMWTAVASIAPGSSRDQNLERKISEMAVDYFSRKPISRVTSTLCHGTESSIWLFKKFSQMGVLFDWLNLKYFREFTVAERLSSKNSNLGVIVDLTCPGAADLLQEAGKNNLFAYRRSLAFWLIITHERFTYESLIDLAKSHIREIDDPVKYLMGSYEDKKNAKYLLEINAKVNREFLASWKKRKSVPIAEVSAANRTGLARLFAFDVFPDDQVALAVPGRDCDEHRFKFFTFYKKTAETRPKVTEIERGCVNRDQKIKPNLEGGLLRAASVILQPDTFTTMDDLATREADLWPKMSHQHVKLLAGDLNFRIIIRYYDDYGWQTNGTFGHLIGLLQQKKADLSAAALLMRTDRFGVIDFLECPFRLQTGVLFREPSLSSIKNIFLLPFSKAIWLSIGAVIVLAVAVLRLRAAAGKTLVPPDNYISNIFDICDYLVGTICQQGFSTPPSSLPARISVLILLLTSVALFTSYSACIVALLQSSSSAILTVRDITNSDLDVGIQSNFTLYRVLMKEASHPVLKEFYRRKVLHKGDKAFCDRREGVEKMRTGMFAFEVELTAGYKLISETFEEREKCGIKEIDLIPKPFICMAVRKDSPYREMFTQRLIWQNEVGLFDRTWKLWVDQKPKCEVGRIGFISVGLTEFRPGLQVFLYGVVSALVLLVVELFNVKFIFIAS